MSLLDPDFYLKGASAADIAAELANGADIHRRTKDGSGALHIAVYYQARPDAIEALIQAGLDVNDLSDDGTTPLHDAASKGHIAAIEILLAHGAHLDASRPDGATALDWAHTYGTPEAAALLRAQAG